MFEDVDWEDPALKRWLGTIARESTKYIYRSAFKAYALFSGMTASALVARALVILDPAGNYYSHDFWGDIAFRDVTTEINNWLDYWKPEMGTDVYVDEVFSDYISRTFASTDEYITWMLSR